MKPTNIDSSESNEQSPQLDLGATKPRFWTGMIAKTTFGMFVVGLVPLVLFGLVTLWQQNKRLSIDTEGAMQASAERVSVQVDEWLDKNVRFLRAAASLEAMASMNRDEQVKVLAAVRQAYPWIYLAFTVNRDGKNIARSDTQPLTNYSDRRYVSDVVVRNQDLGWETLIGKTSGKPALVLSVPIKANGAVVGVLAAAMTIEDISKIVATWKSGKTGFAFLVDETSKVVAHPHTDSVLTQRQLRDHPLIQAYRVDASKRVMRYVDNGAEVLGAVHSTPMKWAVVVEQNTSELMAPLRDTLTLGIGLLVGAIVLVGLFAMVLSRMIVRPILGLTKAADEMSMGNIDLPITASSRDEISMLAESLERLRQSMIVAMKRLDMHG
jgi:methyl-accepting chemotaxis protein